MSFRAEKWCFKINEKCFCASFAMHFCFVCFMKVKNYVTLLGRKLKSRGDDKSAAKCFDLKILENDFASS